MWNHFGTSWYHIWWTDEGGCDRGCVLKKNRETWKFSRYHFQRHRAPRRWVVNILTALAANLTERDLEFEVQKSHFGMVRYVWKKVLYNRKFKGFHPIWIKKRCERYGIYNQDIIGVGFLKHPVLVLIIRDFSGFSHVSFDFVFVAEHFWDLGIRDRKNLPLKCSIARPRRSHPELPTWNIFFELKFQQWKINNQFSQLVTSLFFIVAIFVGMICVKIRTDSWTILWTKFGSALPRKFR